MSDQTPQEPFNAIPSMLIGVLVAFRIKKGEVPGRLAVLVAGNWLSGRVDLEGSRLSASEDPVQLLVLRDVAASGLLDGFGSVFVDCWSVQAFTFSAPEAAQLVVLPPHLQN